ncbi:MAG: hypothetical protein GX804_05280 [Lentisphaerae bacterium]|jgi:hypothetical protein|nr:hypothetical protein [Lentisphaerota bacterium]
MIKNIVRISMLAALIAVVSGCMSKGPEPKGKLHVRVLIDGEDTLYIKGDKMWFVHSSYLVPGKWAGSDLPVYINKDQEWFLEWNGNISNVGVIENPESALPTSGEWDESNMSIDFYTAGYGIAEVLQYPSSENDYTLVVNFDDNEPYSAHWYSVDIDWDEE